MMGVKLMTDRHKKILTRKVKVSAKISKCHKKNSHIFLHSNDCKTPYLDIYIVPWLITTSCLISQFQYPAANLKLSAEDLNFRQRILISGRGFESGLEDQSTNPRPKFWESDIRPRFSSNIVLKLTREKKTNIVNRHQQITTSCLASEFQMSGRRSETFGREFKLSAEDLNNRPRVSVWI